MLKHEGDHEFINSYEGESYFKGGKFLAETHPTDPPGVFYVLEISCARVPRGIVFKNVQVFNPAFVIFLATCSCFSVCR